MISLAQLKKSIRAVATPERARVNAWFFKTGPGQYGAGDKFVGLTVPACRKIAHDFLDVPTAALDALLASPIHEERLIALLIMVKQFQSGTLAEQTKIYQDYLASTRRVNNWNLVDLSADKIVGAHLLDRPKKILYKLARSKNMWERRIAIVATFQFIRHNHFDTTFEIAELLLPDTHDLIHKATGWMLREVGKRDVAVLKRFLRKYITTMPRTTLRYAIERFPEPERKKFLHMVY